MIYMDSDTWNKEYKDIKSIPSSDRMEPSKAFRMGMSIVDQPIDRALFLGCGNGRNMFNVQANECVGVDFSDEAIERARYIAESRDSDNIRLVKSDVREWLNDCEKEFDLIVDSYFSCHFSLDKFSELRDSVRSVSRNDSLYFWSGIGKNDEFYDQVAENLEGSFVRDPNNNVVKRLYDTDELKGEVIEFDKVATNDLYFKDTVNCKEYEREILWGLYNIQ